MEVEVREDFDEGWLETGNDETVLDATDEADGVDLCAYVFQETPNES